jgi:hypothetical protein
MLLRILFDVSFLTLLQLLQSLFPPLGPVGRATNQLGSHQL